MRRNNLTEATTNNFLKCRDVNTLFNIPDVDPWKVSNICNKLCVTTNYVRSDNTYWGGPLICNNQLQGIYSDSIFHESRKKSSWTLPYAYSEWINEVIEYNENRPAELEQYRSCQSSRQNRTFYFTIIITLFFALLLE